MTAITNKHLFSIHIEALNTGRLVRELSIQIESDDEGIQKLLTSPLEGEYFGFDVLSDFSYLSYADRSFLVLFKTTHTGLIERDKNRIRLEAPFDPLFLEKILHYTPLFKIDGKDYCPVFSPSFYPLKIELDQSGNLTIKNSTGFYLPSPGGGFVIDGDKIKPVPSILKSEYLERIFREESFPADNEIKTRLFARKAAQPELMDQAFILPEVRELGDEKILIYYEHRQKEGFMLTAYFEVNSGGRSFEIPFVFDDIRKSITFHEEIILPLDKKTVFVCRTGTPFYDKISGVIHAVKSHFSDFLNEVKNNRIQTQDQESLFQKFFPQVEPYLEIRGRNSVLRVVSGDFDEKTVEFHEGLSSIPGAIDWLEVGFQFRISDVVLTLAEIAHLMRDGFIQKDDVLVSVSEKEMNYLKDLFGDIRIKKDQDKYYLNRYHLPHVLKEGMHLKLPESLRNLQKDLENASNQKKALNDVPIPTGLDAILRDYQKTGVAWLHFLNRNGFSGILADEMGLGKTIQVLTFLLMIKGNGPSLIICPTALVYNWVAEIQKFIGLELSVLVVDGNKAERTQRIKDVNNYDIAITSYPLVHNDSEDYEKITFNYCILDEAQHIKNKQAKRTVSVKGIRSHNRIAITGTPIENSAVELWSIFDFLMPEFLGTHPWFKKNIENPLNAFDLKEKNRALTKLRSMIKPFILRRVKSNVLKELPPKIEQEVLLELTEKQKAIYLETLSAIKNNYYAAVKEKGLENTYLDFLAALTRLRQICLHPGLVNPDMLNMDDASIKLKAVMELIYESIDSGHRVALFSQFVEMLKLIRRELHKESIDYLYIDGQTKNRVELVDHFNKSEIPLFLISLKAGGTGLNIIGADSVILFDPWWNPAVESQAIDRVHRMGQESTVHVYRLITKGTIEEKIKKLQVYKKEVFDNLIVSNQGFIKNMSWKDIQDLFEVHP